MSEPRTARENLGDDANPLGLDGIEYVEFTTARPQALGQWLETFGFRPVARHRSREVLLYRQGGMNLVVNAQPGVVQASDGAAPEVPRIGALALRVRDARLAFERACALGAWETPSHAQVMELNIPGVHGPGGAHIYFVDRCDEFSIFDVDFRRIPGAERHPPAARDLHFFGLVQYIGRDRSDDWCSFWSRLFGFTRLPQETAFGILPGGALLQSPGAAATRFYLQLLEPDPSTLVYDDQELFQRLAFGTPDVPGAVAGLRAAGVEFVDAAGVNVTERGAITHAGRPGLDFELVRDAAR